MRMEKLNPVASACMLIRRPAEDAFQAFADPTVTSRFWYSKSSGAMVPGAELRWEWDTYGASADVRVKEVEQNRLIRFEWGNYAQPTTVELDRKSTRLNSSHVEISYAVFCLKKKKKKK